MGRHPPGGPGTQRRRLRPCLGRHRTLDRVTARSERRDMGPPRLRSDDPFRRMSASGCSWEARGQARSVLGSICQWLVRSSRPAKLTFRSPTSEPDGAADRVGTRRWTPQGRREQLPPALELRHHHPPDLREPDVFTVLGRPSATRPTTTSGAAAFAAIMDIPRGKRVLRSPGP
jgi:hypothetical protein